MSDTAALPDLDSLDPFRLPTVARPTRYDLRLAPSLPDASFVGKVTIQLDVEHETPWLVLNAAELTIAGCTVDGADAAWSLDETTDRSGRHAGGTDSRRDQHARHRVRRHPQRQVRGFYRSTYVDENGVEQVIATTQMQATDFRRAFPCWDEPEFKAVFGVTLEVEAGLTAISNGPETDQQATSTAGPSSASPTRW